MRSEYPDAAKRAKIHDASTPIKCDKRKTRV